MTVCLELRRRRSFETNEIPFRWFSYALAAIASNAAVIVHLSN